jgi:hypothetical protein
MEEMFLNGADETGLPSSRHASKAKTASIGIITRVRF